MNKYFQGSLNTALFMADGDVTSGGVETTPGRAPANAPESENIYGSEKPSSGEESAKGVKGAEGEGGQKQDFTKGAAKGKPAEVDKGYIDLKDPEVTSEEDKGRPENLEVVPEKGDKPALLKLDPETIAELRKGLGGQQPVRQEERKAPSLTPAQLKEMLNPVEVSGDMLKSLGFENATPEQVAGFQTFTNAIVKNAVSIARVMIDQKAKQFEGALSPITENMAKAQVEQTRNDFFTSNKDLAKYDKIVKLAAAEVIPTKADGTDKTKEEIFKEVADKTRATLKEYGVNLTPANLSADDEGGEVQVTKVPAPNKLSSSGRSGGDTNGQRGKPNNADADIYKR